MPKSGILVSLRIAKGDLGLILIPTVTLSLDVFQETHSLGPGSIEKLTASTKICEGQTIGRNPDLILTYLLKEAGLLLVWPSLNAGYGWDDI